MRVMNDEKAKIKRCPFCGSEAHVIASADLFVEVYTVVCNEDYCRCGLAYTDPLCGCATKELAIEKWNRREKKWTSKKK